MTYKRCTDCLMEKEATANNFSHSKTGKLGFKSVCKSCSNITMRNRRIIHGKRYKENAKIKRKERYAQRDPTTKRFVWTLEKLINVAKKCITLDEFIKKEIRAYQAAQRMGIIEDLINLTGLKRSYIKRGHWTKENCAKEALKYKTKKEFTNGSSGACATAYKNGWIDDICSHMTVFQGNRAFRGIYAFEHPDKSVYVGLTYNYEQRYKQHMNTNKLLRKKMSDGGQVFKAFGIFYPAKEASEKEQQLIQKYAEEGWTILNKRKAGSLGSGVVIWTYEKIAKEALKYKTRAEFSKLNCGAYLSAWKNGWIDAVCSHMPVHIYLSGENSPNHKWYFEDIQREALKYKTRAEFQKGSGWAYQVATKRNILGKVCKHMTLLLRNWTFDEVMEEALKYKTRAEFQKNSSAYWWAKRRRLINEICKHMPIRTS